MIDLIPGGLVVCVGDAMVDRYVYGIVERVSPEAPIPVLRITREAGMLGGAGNVVRNLLALGAHPTLVSVRGDDAAGEELAALLARHPDVESHLVVELERQTPVKTRFVAQAQQLLRADRETTAPLSSAARHALVMRAKAVLDGAAVAVLSDYGKGVLKEGIAAELIAAARGRPVLVDPKGTDYGCYRGATLLTPNRHELAEATRLPTGTTDEVITAARRLIETCAVTAVLATRSQDGMTLVHADGTVHHLPAQAREVFDVSGAGDTVVATLAAVLAGGAPLAEAARLANVAAGIVVGKVGTAVASAAEIVAALHHQDLAGGEAKVVTLETALEQVARWRRRLLTVGFTNGCFDLLHPGHVSLLRRARAACNRLIVGLNSDDSVRRLKGETRPVQSETARAVVLASLTDVDLVVLFREDTPLALIEALRPDVLVKGADYTVETVVGASVVQGYGGKILLANLEEGFSTTTTIARMTR
ncbi:MAG: D-beta-D-heptose 7-phosphate kinase / D-beta-D-heptose 1-phosphate adenosyltransferase [Rhodospirillaceae bacterium]|nr:MAG: D-beta-D-heptose 7-phosphate kinase / D-beta-D-heptose 1-phosphate adenosyltransferase [Rhodospirillaceae bacterium]